MLLVPTVLNGKESGYVVLDTAAFCSGISREVATTLSGSHVLPEVRLAAGTGPVFAQRVSAAVHFAIAEQDLIPPEVISLDLSNLSRHYGVEVVGVLGFPTLRSHVFTIDYRNGLVKIETPQGMATGGRDRGNNAQSPTALACR
jgi:hypothetical protein